MTASTGIATSAAEHPAAARGWVRAGAERALATHADAARAAGARVAEQRTRGLLVRALVLLRAVQLAPWPLALLLGVPRAYAHPWLAASSYAVQAGWSAAFMIIAWRRRALPQWLAVIDVLVAAVCLVAAGRACAPGFATGWSNSAVAPAMGAAAVAAVRWPRAGAIAGGVTLAGAYLLGIGPALAAPNTMAATAGNVCSLAGFGVVGGVVTHLLMRGARDLDAEHAARVRAEAAAASERAEFGERMRQYALLHDTVLSTLSSIARGGLDHAEPEVRRRCAAEADFLRGLVSASPREPPTDLAVALAMVSRDQAIAGLRVRCRNRGLPQRLPEQVTAAFTDAVREALNNVVKHAGVSEATVTAVASHGGAVTVIVADQGAGFDTAAVAEGLGLGRSIRQRMANVGGTAEVDSEPGQGTIVELRWQE
jgi:signal transduction histidine kinase